MARMAHKVLSSYVAAPAHTSLPQLMRRYSKRIRTVLIAACVLGACSAVLLTFASFASLRLHVEQTAWDQLVEDAEVLDAIDWEYLHSINPDIVGWITVDNTSISYPILDPSRESVEYYLTHDIWGNVSSTGCIVLAENNLISSNQLYIYGHHLTGTTLMFSELGAAWKEVSFNRIGNLHLFTPETGEVVLEPSCAAHIYETDELYLQQTGSPSALNQWFSQVWERAHVTKDNTYEPITQSITLITCSSPFAQQPWRCAVTFTQPSTTNKQEVRDANAIQL